MESTDYRNRSYLSAIEAAKYLNMSVDMLHNLANRRVIKAQIAASGQMRFDLKELEKYGENVKSESPERNIEVERVNTIEVNGTVQKVIVKNSKKMDGLANDSVHLMVTSPPYFDTKMYSPKPIEGTNPRGAEITKEALSALVTDGESESIPINW